MKKTHLKAVDPKTFRIKTVYESIGGVWRYFIHTDGQYKDVWPDCVFNPETVKELSKQNLVRYLKKQIKDWEEFCDFCGDCRDESRMYDQGIGRIDALKDVLTYVLKHKG